LKRGFKNKPTMNLQQKIDYLMTPYNAKFDIKPKIEFSEEQSSEHEAANDLEMYTIWFTFRFKRRDEKFQNKSREKWRIISDLILNSSNPVFRSKVGSIESRIQVILNKRYTEKNVISFIIRFIAESTQN
jgi:hypothetical protein